MSGGERRIASPDPWLSQDIETERFDLVNLASEEAVEITRHWAADPETLESLMFPDTSYDDAVWARRLTKPDGHWVFYHAIVARESGDTIGSHRVKIDAFNTAVMAIVVHNRDWWGQGVFEEARAGVMDHFSRSPRVLRFFGRVIARNISSVYNYQKLGYRQIGYDRKSWYSPLAKDHVDTFHFEYLAEDWREARGLELI